MGRYYRVWSPSSGTFRKALLVALVMAVFMAPIPDCDEVFNYWEPLHYLIHGTGLQTWEYASQYALRSYAYLLAHAPPLALPLVLNATIGLGSLADGRHYPSAPVADSAWAPVWTRSLPGDANVKLLQFFALRLVLVILAIYVFSALYYVLAQRLRFSHIPIFVLVFMALAPGLFLAVPAFVPSSTAMVALTAAYAAFLDRREALAVALVGVAGLVAWPFAAWAGVPIALHMMFLGPSPLPIVRRVVKFVGFALLAGTVLIGLLLAIDSSFYGSPVLAPLNIVMYNVLATAASGGGSELYGTEPWHYYIRNGIVNFNLAFVLGLLGPFLTVLPGWLSHYNLVCGPSPAFRSRLAAYLWSIWAWLGLMLAQPHKEERFLYPIYPALCVSAAVTLACGASLLDSVLAKCSGDGDAGSSADDDDGKAAFVTRASLTSTLVWMILALFALLAVSRSVVMVVGYGAPLEVYTHLANTEFDPAFRAALPVNASVAVCVGKEWYRFPSHFFFPDARFALHFIDGGFGGLLPQAYAPLLGTLPSTTVPTWSI
ncbi:alpha-1,2-mannosyltransferase ALG9 [Thecamonas trahens ATCC 50062]|uniref:Mannosyltransferase n=1 Tax=Thecamonas trahens ATCC 50062 TaxID=461836 RepID=A0A0L0DLB0_THETB|nr:alpha-1,2-mannosyltransferase ALG9 [Thecamonas trahens ATCC 50062]KNC53119.1 alpha-1,2-mannosyltransferase ALG9 [Thecamonas trahens ATCC 50062]|eukprot:XP_013754786.1 alpha-1,2-mannosyltransferase ALG9 [Thecamonas trahens ATCC 50062]